MITQFRLENFKGHRDTELALSQFTMLVGDNGSGKTSVLEALELQGRILVRRPRLPPRLAVDDYLRRGAPGSARLTSRYAVAGLRGHFTIEFPSHLDKAHANIEPSLSRDEAARDTVQMMAARCYRFDPSMIAAGAHSDTPGIAVGADGKNTAVVLAALKLGDDETFDRIEAHLRTLMPSVERIRIRPAEVTRAKGDAVVGSKLYFDFRGAPGVAAHHASRGTLVAVALLTALLGPGRRRLVLLDDFHHALHPRAQVELVRMLQRLLELDDFRETQIIATTHSPYVLDELPPSSIIAFALRDDGTVASRPLSEHPDAAKTSGALRSGELWSLEAERDWVLGR